MSNLYSWVCQPLRKSLPLLSFPFYKVRSLTGDCWNLSKLEQPLLALRRREEEIQSIRKERLSETRESVQDGGWQYSRRKSVQCSFLGITPEDTSQAHHPTVT